MARAEAPDWDAIHRDYRLGQFSNRELGRLHNVAESTIRKRAENRKWSRDLSDQVRAAVDQQLSRDALPPDARCAGAHCAPESPPSAHQTLAPVRATPLLDDAAIVEAAARRGADVVRGHRAGAARLRQQLDRLSAMVDTRLTWLENWGTYEDAANQVAHTLEGQPQGGALTRRAHDFGLIEAGELLDTMARTFERLARTERQAFNLDGKPGTSVPGLDGDEQRLLTAEQRLASLRTLRARAIEPPAPPPSSAAMH